eukprot:4094245-Amphidinium_carterae.1
MPLQPTLTPLLGRGTLHLDNLIIHFPTTTSPPLGHANHIHSIHRPTHHHIHTALLNRPEDSHVPSIPHVLSCHGTEHIWACLYYCALNLAFPNKGAQGSQISRSVVFVAQVVDKGFANRKPTDIVPFLNHYTTSSGWSCSTAPGKEN